MTKPNLTESQARALSTLRAAGRPLGAYEVLDGMRISRPKAAPPTAYRALDKLIALGLAHRVESMNAYVACCVDHDGAAPMFAICDDCGGVDELADPAALRALTAQAEAGGFVPHKPVVELHGQCAACQSGKR
ncbi:MAG: Fur family transcriptional regulator [Pseudomonadota bacterium]